MECIKSSVKSHLLSLKAIGMLYQDMKVYVGQYVISESHIALLSSLAAHKNNEAVVRVISFVCFKMLSCCSS